ncbi:MAG: hypothetical protein BWY21_00360 [Parcubacteria group bacterium ADurb.Bin216]|nr:MAG: hypothetical protein BWY21_00360 [Parcubacteria group bacterium ADurb.Bin216]
MANYNLTTATGVFKTKYIKMSRDMFNSENVVLAKAKRNDSFVGDQALISVPTSFGGGRGSGSIPKANVTAYQKMLITAKKLYAIIEIDNEAIKASQTDEGAFVRLSKEPVKRGVQAWQANLSRMLFNDSVITNGNGRLGISSSSTAITVASGVYTVTFDKASANPVQWKQANWETKDYINASLIAGTAEYEVTGVNPVASATTATVTLVQTGGSAFNLAGQTAVSFYMQNSKDNDATGLRGALLATSGTLYNVAVGYRWRASSQLTNLSVGITPDLLNQQALDIKYAFGENHDMFVTSFVQYRKLLNQLEDQKRYMIVESRNSGPKGKFSFQALEFMCDTGPIPVIAERFVEDDTLYSLNSDFVEFHARPDGGWVEDPTMGGSIFRLSPTNDTWQARYAVYGEWGILPTAHGIMTGLTTS